MILCLPSTIISHTQFYTKVEENTKNNSYFSFKASYIPNSPSQLREPSWSDKGGDVEKECILPMHVLAGIVYCIPSGTFVPRNYETGIFVVVDCSVNQLLPSHR